MKKITYYIEDVSYHDEYGKLTNTNYNIRYRKSFFGLFPYWKYITHQDGGMGDYYDSRTNWKTIELAETFIKEILCKDIVYDGWVDKTVGEITCK